MIRFELGGNGLVDISKSFEENSEPSIDVVNKSFSVAIAEYLISEVTYTMCKVSTILRGTLYVEKRRALYATEESNKAVYAIEKHFDLKDKSKILVLEFGENVDRFIDSDGKYKKDIYNILVNLVDRKMLSTVCPVNIDYIVLVTDKEVNISGYMYDDGIYIGRVI